VFEKTVQMVSWKFTAHSLVALLNKHNLDMQNGITAAESCVIMVLETEILKAQKHYWKHV
jgi:hypothetical protein